MAESTMPPTNIVDDQSMVAAVTGVASGKNSMIQSGAIRHSAAMLIGRSNVPRDHLRGGSGAPHTRRHTRQAIVVK